MNYQVDTGELQILSEDGRVVVADKSGKLK